jgi:hypothetical protein
MLAGGILTVRIAVGRTGDLGSGDATLAGLDLGPSSGGAWLAAGPRRWLRFRDLTGGAAPAAWNGMISALGITWLHANGLLMFAAAYS